MGALLVGLCRKLNMFPLFFTPGLRLLHALFEWPVSVLFKLRIVACTASVIRQEISHVATRIEAL